MHDCYKLSIITTTRKCVSVVVSAFAFNHAFTQVQWLGASMVLGSTCMEVYLGNKRKREQAQKQAMEAMEKLSLSAEDSDSTSVSSVGKIKKM